MTDMQVLLTVLIAAGMTILLRAAPFLLFPSGKQAPAFITWLGNQLPRAVIMMLLVYCLKDISLTTAPYGAPALIAVAVNGRAACVEAADDPLHCRGHGGLYGADPSVGHVSDVLERKNALLRLHSWTDHPPCAMLLHKEVEGS